MKVAIVAEFYPRRADPVLGVWAHRQALAARDAGAEVRVLVLHRLVPPRSVFNLGPTRPARSTRPARPTRLTETARALYALARQPHRELRDGLQVNYVRYLSPPRSGSYHAWGAWAAPALALALARLRREFPYELIHAHNAVPAADAVRRARARAPLAISVHGGDVLYTAPRSPAGAAAVRKNLAAAATVLANSRDIAELARGSGALDTCVVHLGTDLPDARATGGLRTSKLRGDRAAQTLVTVGHLVARKRHADVIKALAVLAKRHPTLRYEIVGDGPERAALERLARQLQVDERVVFHGQLPHEQAVALARGCTLFAMPSTEEAFGVAYIEAMAGGVPAIGCRGEPGPEEIAAAGDGFVLVPPGDIERLTQRIDELLGDPQRLREASMRARETVAANFTWKRCGEQTLAAYEHALSVGHRR